MTFVELHLPAHAHFQKCTVTYLSPVELKVVTRLPDTDIECYSKKNTLKIQIMSEQEMRQEDQEATGSSVNLCSLKHTICYFNQNQNQNTLLIPPRGKLCLFPMHHAN